MAAIHQEPVYSQTLGTSFGPDSPQVLPKRKTLVANIRITYAHLLAAETCKDPRTRRDT